MNEGREIKWLENREPSMKKVCEFCGKPAGWKRPYIQLLSPHTQTWWLTLCEECDRHQRESGQELMARLGYKLTFHPDAFNHRIRTFYL